MKELEDVKKVETEELAVDVIIGTGAILSAAPDIDVDTLIFLDRNPVIHEWVTYCTQALDQSDSREAYRRN